MHKYTDQELDAETGLYFYNARYYDPVLGRFISADSIIPDPSDPQAFNRYSYVRNNPLRYTDPSGHFLIEAMVVGAVIGAISSGSQSDWNGQAMLQGALIGAAAGATGYGAGMYAYGLAGGSGLGAMMAGGIGGGAAGGATAGGLYASTYGGDIGQGMLIGAEYGAIAGGATAGLMYAGVPGAFAAAGGEYSSGYAQCGTACGEQGAMYAFGGQVLNNAFVMNNTFGTREAVPPALKKGEYGPNRLTQMQSQDRTYVTTPELSFKGMNALWSMMALLGNGYSHTWHTQDAYTPTGHYSDAVQNNVPYPGEAYNNKNSYNLITNNCTSRVGYTSPGQYYSNFNYAGQGAYWWGR